MKSASGTRRAFSQKTSTADISSARTIPVNARHFAVTVRYRLQARILDDVSHAYGSIDTCSRITVTADTKGQLNRDYLIEIRAYGLRAGWSAINYAGVTELRNIFLLLRGEGDWGLL